MPFAMSALALLFLVTSLVRSLMSFLFSRSRFSFPSSLLSLSSLSPLSLLPSLSSGSGLGSGSPFAGCALRFEAARVFAIL